MNHIISDKTILTISKYVARFQKELLLILSVGYFCNVIIQVVIIYVCFVTEQDEETYCGYLVSVVT